MNAQQGWRNSGGGTTGGLVYKGTWNAATNTPTLSNGGGGGSQGDYYVISVAGTTSIDGISDWEVGDWIVNNGTVWEKVDNTDQVTSVNGLQGAVSIDLASVLGEDPATGGNDIDITSGDTITWNEGSGGILNSLATTAIRTWSLPNKSGTIALTSDIPSTPALSAVMAVGNTTGNVDVDFGTNNVGLAWTSQNANSIFIKKSSVGAYDQIWSETGDGEWYWVADSLAGGAFGFAEYKISGYLGYHEWDAGNMYLYGNDGADPVVTMPNTTTSMIDSAIARTLVTKEWVNAQGFGIYGGSGTVPTAVVATLTDYIDFSGNFIGDAYVQISNQSTNGGATASLHLLADDNESTLTVYNETAVSPNTDFTVLDVENRFDLRSGGTSRITVDSNGDVSLGFYSITIGARLRNRGRGTTSGTTNALFENSGGNPLATLYDDGTSHFITYPSSLHDSAIFESNGHGTNVVVQSGNSTRFSRIIVRDDSVGTPVEGYFQIWNNLHARTYLRGSTGVWSQNDLFSIIDDATNNSYKWIQGTPSSEVVVAELNADMFETPLMTIADINAVGAKNLTTVEWVQAEIDTGQTYSVSNVTTDRVLDADATSLDEVADILGTLITDLQGVGILN